MNVQTFENPRKDDAEANISLLWTIKLKIYLWSCMKVGTSECQSEQQLSAHKE